MPDNNKPIELHNLREAIYVSQKQGHNAALQFYCEALLNKVMPKVVPHLSNAAQSCQSVDDMMCTIAAMELYAKLLRSTLPEPDNERMVDEIIKPSIKLEIVSVRMPNFPGNVANGET